MAHTLEHVRGGMINGTFVSNRRQQRNQDGDVDEIALGKLLGVEADPRKSPIAFAEQLRMKLDAVMAQLGGEPTDMEYDDDEDEDMMEEMQDDDDFEEEDEEGVRLSRRRAANTGVGFSDPWPLQLHDVIRAERRVRNKRSSKCNCERKRGSRVNGTPTVNMQGIDWDDDVSVMTAYERM